MLPCFSVAAASGRLAAGETKDKDQVKEGCFDSK
jgi:hypothetical protein